jgi:antitoxin component YwqK of YwqJK toxin-antitoxin module
MKPTFLLLVTVGIATCAHAQTKRLYFDNNLNAVTDSTKAASKVILSKYADDTSLWAASQYTMDNRLTVEGVYKDQNLTIPHGPFKYYLNIGGKNILAHSGSFFNGVKYGEWIDYYADGKKMRLTTMRGEEMNGPFAYYNDRDTTPSMKGQYVKGKKNGPWISAGKTDIFKDGIITETIPNKEYEKRNAMIVDAAQRLRRQEHITAAIEPIDFGKYMQQRLSSYFKPYFEKSAGTAIIIMFTVNEQGKLSNGKSLTRVSDDVQLQVAHAIDNAPYWAPAQANGKPVSQNVNYTFIYDNIK